MERKSGVAVRSLLVLSLLSGIPTPAASGPNPLPAINEDVTTISTRLVNAVAISPDGSRIVCGGNDGSVTAYDLSGKKRWVTKSTDTPVYSIAIDAAGARVASAGPRRMPWKHNGVGPDVDLDEFRDNLPVPFVGNWRRGLARVAIGGRLELRHLGSGNLIEDFDDFDEPIQWAGFAERPPGPLTVDWSFRGRRYFSKDRSIRSDNRAMKREPGINTRIQTAATPTGERVVAIARDVSEPAGCPAALKLWDSEKNSYRVVPTDGIAPGVRAVAFSPDGFTFATCVNSDCVALWDFETGKVVRSVTTMGGRITNVDILAFSHDGSALAMGDRDGVVRIVDIRSGRLIRQHAAIGVPVRAIAFVPGGVRVVSGGYFVPGSRFPAINDREAEPLKSFVIPE